MRRKRPAPAGNIGLETNSKTIAAFRAEFTRCDVVEVDALAWLAGYPWRGDELVYLDPPYLKLDIDGSPVRISQDDLYEHEFHTLDDHRRLLALVESLPCMVMLSGYRSRLYDQTLRAPKWRRVEFITYDRQHRRRVECLWCNFEQPKALHDTKHVGSNYRERWKLTKMRRRWSAKIAKMEPLQRQALMEAISSSNAEVGAAYLERPAAPEMALRDPNAETGAAAGDSAESVVAISAPIVSVHISPPL